MATYYPPASFYFTVKFSGINTAEDASFSEVSGLEAERPVVEIKEGGENRFSYRVPDRGRYGNLVLKRGLLVWTSELAGWCQQTIESDLGNPVMTRGIDIVLLDLDATPLMVWSVKDAWPVKWSVSALVADKNEIAVETLELAFSSFSRNSQPVGQRYLAAANK
jgi:phage tail-like protein